MVGTQLDCPVPMYQDEREMADLLERLRELKPLRILEVGSLYGGTLWHWLHHFPGATVVSVDAIAQGVPEHPKEKILACRAKWPGWAKETGGELHIITGQSDCGLVINDARKHGPYDFIFVDAGHKRYQVLHDHLVYWPMLREGGLMAFHDCACRDGYPNIDVGTWWRDLESKGEHKTELISHIPGWWGIGVISK